jgi:hypothetical protein
MVNNRGQATLLGIFALVGFLAIIPILIFLPNLTNLIKFVIGNFYIILGGIFFIGFLAVLLIDEEKRPKGLSNKVIFGGMAVAFAVTLFLAIGVSPAAAYISKTVSNYNSTLPVQITVDYQLSPPFNIGGYSYNGVTISNVKPIVTTDAPLSLVPYFDSLIPFNYNTGVQETVNVQLNCDDNGKVYSGLDHQIDTVTTSSYKFSASFINVPNSIQCTIGIVCVAGVGCTVPTYSTVITT